MIFRKKVLTLLETSPLPSRYNTIVCERPTQNFWSIKEHETLEATKMIVIHNSIKLPLISRIGQGLSTRYSAGAHIDLHALADGRDGVSSTSLFDDVCERVCSEKHQGNADLALTSTFDTPQQLKDLRGRLSEYDDEIYAFRLPFAPPVFATLLETFEREAHALSATYSRWLEHQETGARFGDMGYEIIIQSVNPDDTVSAVWHDIHAPVELVEYQQTWPRMFAREQELILNALQGMICSLGHIGSTAIPGMLAKPIIDILITVNQLDNAIPCIQPLRELGYAFIDYPQNTDRRFFRKGTPRAYHIHIVEHDSPSARAYVQFRAALLSDAGLRQEYLQLKQESLQKFKYRRALYGERKGVLIRKALSKSNVYT